MYLSTYIYIYIYKYTYTYICLYTYILVYLYRYMYIFIYTYIHRYTYICKYVCVCLYICFLYICVCIHVNVCVYIHWSLCLPIERRSSNVSSKYVTPFHRFVFSTLFLCLGWTMEFYHKFRVKTRQATVFLLQVTQIHTRTRRRQTDCPKIFLNSSGGRTRPLKTSRYWTRLTQCGTHPK